MLSTTKSSADFDPTFKANTSAPAVLIKSKPVKSNVTNTHWPFVSIVPV